jgi:ABC-type phosphate transport system substrate-binding protein
MKRFFVLLTVLLIMICSNADVFKIIVNPELEITEIDKELLKNIFLGKKSKFDNGEKVEPVMLKSEKLYSEFVKTVTGKSEKQFDTYWKKKIFTGKGKPPRTFENEQDIINYVKENKDAIGFISASSEGEGFKVITLK